MHHCSVSLLILCVIKISRKQTGGEGELVCFASFKYQYQSFVPFFGLKIQGLFKDFQRHIFHFSRTPRTAKWIAIMIVCTCVLLLGVATFLPVAYIFTQGTLESMSDKISYKFQGLSNTDCNFQGLSRP